MSGQKLYFLRPFAADEYWSHQQPFLDWISAEACFTDMNVLKKCGKCRAKSHGSYVRSADSPLDELPSLVCFSREEWKRWNTSESVSLPDGYSFLMSQNPHLHQDRADVVESVDDGGESTTVADVTDPKQTRRFSLADLLKLVSLHPSMPSMPSFRMRFPRFNMTFSVWLPPYWFDWKRSAAALRPFLLRWTVFAKFDDTFENRVATELEKLASDRTAGIDIRFAPEYIHSLLFYLSSASSHLVTPNMDAPVRTMPGLNLVTTAQESKQLFARLVVAYVWKVTVLVHNIVRVKVTEEEFWQNAVQDELRKILVALRQTSATQTYPWINLKPAGTKENARLDPASEPPRPAQPIMSAGALNLLRSRTGLGRYLRRETDASTDLRELAKSSSELVVVTSGRELKSRFERVVPEVMRRFVGSDSSDVPPIFQQDAAFVLSFMRIMSARDPNTFQREASKSGLVELATRAEDNRPLTLTHDQTLFVFHAVVLVTHSTDRLVRFFDSLATGSVQADGLHFAATLAWSVLNRKTLVAANLCNVAASGIGTFVRNRLVQELSVRAGTSGNSRLSRFVESVGRSDTGVAVFDEISRLVDASLSEVRARLSPPRPPPSSTPVSNAVAPATSQLARQPSVNSILGSPSVRRPAPSPNTVAPATTPLARQPSVNSILGSPSVRPGTDLLMGGRRRVRK